MLSGLETLPCSDAIVSLGEGTPEPLSLQVARHLADIPEASLVSAAEAAPFSDAVAVIPPCPADTLAACDAQL